MKREGTSTIEILLVIFIIGTIASMGVLMLFNSKRGADIDSEATRISALISEAQSRSVSQSEGGAWGVHFENSANNPFYSLFVNSYSSSTNRGTYTLPKSIEFATSSLAIGASKEIMFKEISGSASSTFSIVIRYAKPPLTSVTINVSSTGAVSHY